MRSKKEILLLIILVLIFCGCQKTPEKPIVINKVDGKLEETIKATSQATNTNANKWVNDLSRTWEEIYTKQYFDCNINAQIIVPETNIFPVYEVAKRTFNAEFANTIVRFFTKDATGVLATSDTKEELEQQLVQVKRGEYVLDDKGGRWVHYEGQEQDIAELEERIKNAKTEVFEPISNDTIPLPVDNTYSMVDGSRVYITANENKIYYTSEKHGLLQFESWVKEGNARPGEPEGTTLKNVKISEDEAHEEIITLITKIQLENMGIAAIEKARIINDLTGETITEGWVATLTRSDGKSLAMDFSSMQLDGLLYFTPDEYIKRWHPESITVFVDETGIRSFYWRDPLVVTEELNANVPLLPFEDAKERIRKSIEYGLAQRYERGRFSGFMYITVDKIVLTNVLVPIKDDLDHQMLDPAWLVFYNSYFYVNDKKYEVSNSVFAINAIDGSSIDIAIRVNKDDLIP